MGSSKIQHYRSRSTFLGADEAFWVNQPLLQNDLVPTHDHDFAEIVLIRAGEGRHLSIYGEEKLTTGSCLLLLPGTWHGFQVRDRLEVVNCCFRPELLEREIAIAGLDGALQGLFDPVAGVALRGASPRNMRGPAHFRLENAPLDQALGYCEKLFQCQQQAGEAAQLERRGHFLLLLGLISRSLSPSVREFWERAVVWPPAVREVVRLLESGLTRDWTLAALAAKVHLEPSYLGRLFKKHVNETPFEYLQRRRLERAAALLLRTDDAVSNIATQTGYKNFPYFSRSFRACYGVSPLQYRRRGAKRPEPM